MGYWTSTSIAVVVYLLALGVCVALFPPAEGEALDVVGVVRPWLMMGAVVLAIWLRSGRAARESWSRTQPSARVLLFVTLGLYVLWSTAAISAAVQLGDGRLVPAWAHTARYLAFAGLIVGVIIELTARSRRA
jgi:amino acid transporter